MLTLPSSECYAIKRHTVTALYLLGTILGAHAVAYLLIGVLPNAAVSALGIFSGNQELLSAFSLSFAPRTYIEAVSGLFVGDLGRTLDGQAVTLELTRALGASVPRLVASMFLLAALCFATAMWVKERTALLQDVADFVAFLPPFVAPFLGVAGLLAIEFAIGLPVPRPAYEIVAVVALSAGGGALLVAQTARITQRNLLSEFVRSIRAAGANEFQTRLRILHNLIAEISPTFEKLAVGLVATLFFAEPILGLSGFGTLAARAVRRSDVDLLLGVTLTVAVLVAVFRQATSMIRSSYGLSD